MIVGTVTPNASVDKLYMVESLNPYNVSRVLRVNNTAGGKGLNVARIVALAGEKALAGGFIGGYNGMYFESLIKEEGIEKNFTKVKGETRCCVNLWDMEQNKSTEYLEPGFTVSAEDVELFMDDYNVTATRSDVICVSGSFPPGVPDDLCARMVRVARELGKPILVDTAGIQMELAYLARPTMMKPNTDEIIQLMDVDVTDRASLIYATKQMYANGVKIAAVSLGADGIIVTCGEGTFHVYPPRVEAVNTVGSGDSMIGGFAVGMGRGYSIEETMRFGCAVATANVMDMNTGSYRQEDLDWLMPKIVIEKLF